MSDGPRQATTLTRAFGDLEAQFDVDVSEMCYWGMGTRVRAVVEPRSIEELSRIMSELSALGVARCVIGAGSNLMFDSAGFDGAVIRVGDQMSAISIDGESVLVEAGARVPDLAFACGLAGLQGLEHIVGIPGTVGGLVAMNGGSLRQSIGSVVEFVDVVTSTGDLVRVSHEQCGFEYRSSVFQRLDCVIARVGLRLEKGTVSDIEASMSKILWDRAAKFPSEVASCGSTFLSNPTMFAAVGPPGKLIEEAGLKGLARGDAEISRVHANFFLNRDRARSDDMLWLIAVARNNVRARTGFEMACEAKFIESTGVVVPAHVAATRRWGNETFETVVAE